MTVGNGHDATQAILGWSGFTCDCCGEEQFDAKTIIGRGESRTAWLIGGVVYKVGRDAVNEVEHDRLTAWRMAGAGWAPATTLYRGTGVDGDPATVLAMPYLPDDGLVDPATLAVIKQIAPQTCRENYVNHAGQTWLIDGGDIELLPAVMPV